MDWPMFDHSIKTLALLCNCLYWSNFETVALFIQDMLKEVP